MSRKRRVRSAAFKGKVALEALKELKPINVLASRYEIQPNQISTWKKQLKEGVTEIFSRKRGKAKDDSRKAEKGRTVYRRALPYSSVITVLTMGSTLFVYPVQKKVVIQKVCCHNQL